MCHHHAYHPSRTNSPQHTTQRRRYELLPLVLRRPIAAQLLFLLEAVVFGFVNLLFSTVENAPALAASFRRPRKPTLNERPE